MNTVTLALGAAMLGCGIYVLVNFGAGWDTVISVSAVYAGIAAGVIMLIVSLLGCAAAQKNQNKCLVFTYAVLVCIALALQIGAAVVVYDYSNILAGNDTLISGELTQQVDISVNNGLLSAFAACCSGCPSCNNAAAFYNQTLPNCDSTEITCDQVAPCTSTEDTVCYVYGVNATQPVPVPPTKIDIGMCTVLADLTQNGTKIVGPVDEGSCGAGSAAQFVQNFNDYFSASFKWLAISFAVLAGLQFLVIVASLTIMCCSSREVTERRLQ